MDYLSYSIRQMKAKLIIISVTTTEVSELDMEFSRRKNTFKKDNLSTINQTNMALKQILISELIADYGKKG